MVADLISGESVEHSLSLNNLPDDILILIFNRLYDLKCLCLCSLVSPRFSSLILLHVHSVSFAVARPTPPSNTLSQKLLRFCRRFVFGATRNALPPMISSFYSESFPSALYFLSTLKSIRSFNLILPSYPHKLKRNPNPNLSDSPIFKWTAKFGPNVDTLVFFFASSIRDENLDQEEEEVYSESTAFELRCNRIRLAFEYVHDVILWHRMLLSLIEEHPLLQDITITDSLNQGNLSLRDSRLVEMRDWIKSELKKIELLNLPIHVGYKNQGNLSLSDSEIEEMRNWIISLGLKICWAQLKKIELPVSFEHWHVPMLKLPVSGKVMKNATLVLMEMVDRGHLHRDLGGDATAIANLFGEGEEEFGEAIVEMMVNHQSMIAALD